LIFDQCLNTTKASGVAYKELWGLQANGGVKLRADDFEASN
jgi:hypothetical protein